MVQGFIAGGDTALRHSIEGAEDDATAGAGAVRRSFIDLILPHEGDYDGWGAEIRKE